MIVQNLAESQSCVLWLLKGECLASQKHHLTLYRFSPNRRDQYLILGYCPLPSMLLTACWSPEMSEGVLQEGFGLLSSPSLCGRGVGWDVILPKAEWPQTEVLPPQA